MGLFDKLTGLVSGLLDKLGPIADLLPLLLGALKTKMNDEDVDGMREVGIQIEQAGRALSDLGLTVQAAVASSGPGGGDITGTEYAALAAKIAKASDELYDIAQAVKEL